jgi:amidase
MKASLFVYFLAKPTFLLHQRRPLSDSLSTTTSIMASKHLEVEGDILSLDAHSLSKRMEAGEVTSLELMNATLSRIHQLNPTYRALINLLPDDVLLEKARQADKAPHRKGWLHGIPVAIKDLSDAHRFPTTLGGSPLVNHTVVASANEDFCQRLVEAGAIVIGKTNTPEHGLGSHTFNTKWGTTINPYSSSTQPLSAGGSSGGAAVAIATRMLCIADGSDMMGSLRNPAGWNNIYSLRPTAGMMGPDDNDYNPLPFPISTVGPMARTPQDLALLLETMSNGVFDESSVQEESHVGDMRIAWLGDWNGAFPMEDGIQQLCRQALGTFEETADVVVTDIDEPLFDAAKLWDSWTTIRSKIIAATAIDEYGKEAFFGSDFKVKKEFVWEVKRGVELSDAQVADATAIASEWSACTSDAFTKYDALALPTAQVWPFDSRLDWPKFIGANEMDTYHRWMQVVVPATLGGLPVVTIPAGFNNNEGLSMGIQLIGARGSDAKLLSLAQAYHEVTDWPSRRPPRLLLNCSSS